jgi:hypothetical protein
MEKKRNLVMQRDSQMLFHLKTPAKSKTRKTAKTLKETVKIHQRKRSPESHLLMPSALSNHNFRFDRHSRAGGNPEHRKLDSRLRGNDNPLFLALTRQTSISRILFEFQNHPVILDCDLKEFSKQSVKELRTRQWLCRRFNLNRLIQLCLDFR